MKAKKPGHSAYRRESTPYLEASRRFEEGIQLLYSKSLKKARETFQLIVSNYPEEKEMVDRARTYIKICEATRARRDTPLETAEEYYTRGTFRLNEGNLDGAIEDYQEAIHKEAKVDYLPYCLAATYALKGDTNLAAKFLEKAIKLNPENRDLALHDDDFGGMIEDPIFIELLQVDVK